MSCSFLPSATNIRVSPPPTYPPASILRLIARVGQGAGAAAAAAGTVAEAEMVAEAAESESVASGSGERGRNSDPFKLMFP